MNDLETRVQNALEAINELIAFFDRVEERRWPRHFHRIADYLKALRITDAVAQYERIPKGNMGGLYDLVICRENGHKTTDRDRDNALFMRLVGQVSTTLRNLKVYVDEGVAVPLVEIERGT